MDIGGSKMLAGLVGDDGHPGATRQVATRRATYLNDLGQLVAELMAEAEIADTTVRGIGVGTTGLVDRISGSLRGSIALGLREIPIRDALESLFHVPVFVDNDIHAAALGELSFGAGGHHDDFVVVNAGTGVSVGIVLGHRLHRGASNIAGEMGHTSINLDGPACTCGLPGCLEALVLEARNTRVVRSVAFAHVFDPAPSAEYAYIALGIVNLVNLLNPEAVILTGGMFTNNPVAVNWLKAVVGAEALEAAVAGLSHFGVSVAGKEAGLVGAAALVLEGLSQGTGKRTHD